MTSSSPSSNEKQQQQQQQQQQQADDEEETILVLYASQTGNAEQAAQEIASKIPQKILKQSTSSSSSSSSSVVNAKCMHLDDFLLEEQCRWTRLVIFVTSSYGVGQAPLGGYEFREFCDCLLEDSDASAAAAAANDHSDNNNNNKSKNINIPDLSSLTYCLLGLGDSMYTTFFRNPTVLDQAMTKAGAKRIGKLGKADASSGRQSEIISEWIDDLWVVLRNHYNNNNKTNKKEAQSASRETLENMQKATLEYCRQKLESVKNSSNTTDSGNNTGIGKMVNMVAAILVALVAVMAYYYTTTTTNQQ